MRITENRLRRIIREAVVLSSRLTFGKSTIHGTGIFVQESLPAGTDLGPAQIRQTDGSWIITELGKYHNHSAVPTCRNQLVGNTRHLITQRELLPGDEVTIDYRLQPELEQPFPEWR